MAMGSVIAVNVWKGIPFFTLLLLAGLKAIDTRAARGGRGRWRQRGAALPPRHAAGACATCIIVVLLLSFISTFNQFGLIFLMTGGGPSGATRLYSILAYEKAIGSLQYGPGTRDRAQRGAADGAAHLAARASSCGTTTARPREREAPGIGDRDRRALRRASSSWLLDVIFWPFDLLSAASSASSGWCGRADHRLAGQAGAQAGRRARADGYRLRLLILLPFMVFVLFPFYWVIITSFKTTPQISAAAVDLLAGARRRIEQYHARSFRTRRS